MATQAPMGDPAWTITPYPHINNTYIRPWEPYPQPWTPEPWTPYPGIQPWVPPTTGTTTTTIRIRSEEDKQRIAELEALLQLAHDLLLAGDDDDSDALCELIEDAVEL